jgi:hypothetical protein
MSSSNPDLDFPRYSDFHQAGDEGQIVAAVCDGKEMAHAGHVMKKFWNSGARTYVAAGRNIDLSTHPCRSDPVFFGPIFGPGGRP